MNKELPFDFKQLDDAAKKAPPPAEPFFLTATDKIQLAVREYMPRGTASAALVFYHGGGAHSGAGYQLLAQGLAETYGLAVYTPDLRGHGASQGPRGDAPTSDQVLQDINTVLEFVAKKGLPVFLGGHSSGGGVIVNYATWQQRRKDVKAYVLLSPQLGYLAKVDRQSSTPDFAKVNVLAFIFNGITGLMGHKHAVQFQYPSEVLEGDSGMVKSNTVNMANAITPTSPQTQFKEIDLPLALWVGSEDELFVAEKVASFAQGKENMTGVVLPGESHLGILVDAYKPIGLWITERLKET